MRLHRNQTRPKLAKGKLLVRGDQEEAFSKEVDELMKRFGGRRRMWKRSAAKVAKRMQKELKRCIRWHKTRVAHTARKSNYLPKWYNKEARHIRAEVNRLGKDNPGGIEYQEAKHRLQRLVRIKKRILKKKTDENRLRQLETNPKKFWSILNRKNATLPIMDVSMWLQYGELLYNSIDSQHQGEPELREHDGTEYFTEKIVQEAVSKLKRGRSADSNGLMAEILKALSETSMTSDDQAVQQDQ